jgi:hypothetical protein
MTDPDVLGRMRPAPKIGKWDSLEDLKADALRQGCTPAQFAYSVESAGPEVADIAVFLHRQKFMR